MADGDWHKVEIFGKYNTNSEANGILRVWGDDSLKYENTSFTWRTGDWATDVFRLFYLPSNAGDGTHQAGEGDIVYYDDIEIWDSMPTENGNGGSTSTGTMTGGGAGIGTHGTGIIK